MHNYKTHIITKAYDTNNNTLLINTNITAMHNHITQTKLGYVYTTKYILKSRKNSRGT